MKEQIKVNLDFATGGIVNNYPVLVYDHFEENDALHFYMNNQDKKAIKELVDIRELIDKLHQIIEDYE